MDNSKEYARGFEDGLKIATFATNILESFICIGGPLEFDIKDAVDYLRKFILSERTENGVCRDDEELQ